jgi:hypothetical protein
MVVVQVMIAQGAVCKNGFQTNLTRHAEDGSNEVHAHQHMQELSTLQYWPNTTPVGYCDELLNVVDNQHTCNKHCNNR